MQAGIVGHYAVVPNAIDLTRCTPITADARAALRRTLGLTDAPLAVSVGRLTHQKGHDVLVTAWPAVLRRVPDARLVLVGDGPLRSKLSRGLAPSITLV